MRKGEDDYGGLRVDQAKRLKELEKENAQLKKLVADQALDNDFVFDRTRDGRPLRMLTIVDEYTRECLAIDVARRLTSEDVLDRLEKLFVGRGTPVYLRSDRSSPILAGNSGGGRAL